MKSNDGDWSPYNKESCFDEEHIPSFNNISSPGSKGSGSESSDSDYLEVAEVRIPTVDNCVGVFPSGGPS